MLFQSEGTSLTETLTHHTDIHITLCWHWLLTQRGWSVQGPASSSPFQQKKQMYGAQASFYPETIMGKGSSAFEILRNKFTTFC